MKQISELIQKNTVESTDQFVIDDSNKHTRKVTANAIKSFASKTISGIAYSNKFNNPDVSFSNVESVEQSGCRYDASKKCIYYKVKTDCFLNMPVVTADLDGTQTLFFKITIPSSKNQIYGILYSEPWDTQAYGTLCIPCKKDTEIQVFHQQTNEKLSNESKWRDFYGVAFPTEFELQ